LNPSLFLQVTYVPYYYPYAKKKNTTQTSRPPVGSEPAIPTSERLQTYALDRTATGLGMGFGIQASNSSEKPANSIFYTEDGSSVLL
jgi:hypothetical protein